jgi:hypothetical protein
MDSVKGAPSHLYFIRPAGRGVRLAKAGIEKAALPRGLPKPLFFSSVCAVYDSAL